MMDNKMILLADSRHGIYAPMVAVDNLCRILGKRVCGNKTLSAAADLLAMTTDDPNYWETWAELEQDFSHTDDDGKTWRLLSFEGDIWLLEGSEIEKFFN